VFCGRVKNGEERLGEKSFHHLNSVRGGKEKNETVRQTKHERLKIWKSVTEKKSNKYSFE